MLGADFPILIQGSSSQTVPAKFRLLALPNSDREFFGNAFLFCEHHARGGIARLSCRQLPRKFLPA